MAYATGLTDTYVGVLPYTSPERHLCASSRVLWVDIDTCGAEEELRAVTGLPEASMVVYSGRGLHLYWALSEDVPLDVMEVCNIGLAKALGGDHCWDRKRVLRLPTTINSKTGNVCRILRYNNNSSYALEQFASFYEPVVGRGPDASMSGAEVSIRGAEYSAMPSWWKSLVEHGGRSSSAQYSFKNGVLDNSHMLFNIINVAKREGMTEDDLYELYRRGAAGFEKLRGGTTESAYAYIARVYARCTPYNRAKKATC
jgi:hypothetical protein